MGTDHRRRTYDVCLRFFAELRALGVREAVVSPGSRSTPLALAAHAVGLRCRIHLDERVGGFHALGAAKATGVPAVLVCSSGTAGANYTPAVIEAHHAGVPMIVCTADRPPELRTWGAGQTVDQRAFFTGATRWAHELPVAAEVAADHGRSVALRAWHAAVGDPAGPVHLNWPFREPLEPEGRLVSPTATVAVPVPRVARAAVDPGLDELAGDIERGLVVVGPGDRNGDEVRSILDFAASAGWPVVADPAARLRRSEYPSDAVVVSTGELLFAAPSFTEAIGHVGAVVRVGEAPTSKAYRLWLEGAPPHHLVLVGPGVEWADPTDSFTHAIPGPVADALGPATCGRGSSTAWCEQWRSADAAARAVVAAHVAADRGELAVAAALLDAAPDGADLVVASSMPIRDLDLVMPAAGHPLRVLANRGANGIDGTIATALGAATASGRPTIVFLGDVAAVHDLGGLAAATRLGVDLVVVVVDNDGGGIFSFLPIAGVAAADVFDELFTTPHHTDLPATAAALGAEAVDVAVDEVGATVATALDAGGVHVVRVATSAADTVAAFAAIRAAVDAELT